MKTVSRRIHHFFERLFLFFFSSIIRDSIMRFFAIDLPQLYLSSTVSRFDLSHMTSEKLLCVEIEFFIKKFLSVSTISTKYIYAIVITTARHHCPMQSVAFD
jgi:hypothetical protein